VIAECGGRVSRRLFAPQLVDQPLAAHDLVRMQHQEGEQGPPFRASDLNQPIAIENLQRAENPKLHLAPTVAPSSGSENPLEAP
jgi:hypothetical protein